MISIDNVILLITYDVIIPVEPNFIFLAFFILASIGAAVLATYIILYQLILKYPVPVRKVRKYRKTLTNSKIPDVKIIERKRAFNKGFQEELNRTTKLLKGAPPHKSIAKPKRAEPQKEKLIQK